MISKEGNFTAIRQYPTHAHEEGDNLGLVDLPRFLEIFRNVDWRHEAIQAEWAKKAAPAILITNLNDKCTLSVSAIVAGSVIDVDAEPDERFRTDKHEPWYSVEMQNPPDYSNVFALDPHGIGENLGFMAFTPERVEECFRWFFEEDYRSLYELFRWV